MYRFAVAAAVLLATSAPVSAGPFVGLGIGTGGSVNGDLKKIGLGEDGRSGRLMGGYSFPLKTGRLSIDGLVSWYDLDRNMEWNVKQAALAGRYNFPLGDNFEVFGRLGVARMWLSGDGDFAGTGWLFGAGFEYRFNLVAAGMSAFVDWTRISATLDDGSGAYNYETSPHMWTAGLTLSF